MSSASVPPPSAADVLTADTEHDPDAWLRILSWMVVVFSLAQVLVFSFGRDQGIYAVVGDGILLGEIPYRDRWDFKPPGIFFIHALASALFGQSMLAPRLLEVAALLGAVLGLRRLGGQFFDSRTAGLLGGACYALVHSQLDFWHTGQPESFAGPLTIFALVLTTHDWSRRRMALAWIGVGLLFGMAFLLKPPFGGGAIACAYALSAKRRAEGLGWARAGTPFFWIGLSSLLPIVCCVLWFVLNGGYPAMSWTLFDFAPGYTALSWEQREAGAMFFDALTDAFFRHSSVLGLGTVAALALHPRAQREREGVVLLLGVLAFQLVGITIQGKFFQYHYGASFPLVALIAGQGYYKLWRRIGPGSPSGTFSFAAFLLIAATMRLPVYDTPGSYWERSAIRLQYLLSGGHSLSREELDERLHYVGGYNLFSARRAAHEVKQLTVPGAPIYIWGFEPIIYRLSERRPSSAYIYNVPQRARWETDRAWRRLWAELQEHPPATIVTQRRDVMPFVTGSRLDSVDSLRQFPQFLSYLEEKFEHQSTVDRFEIWTRKAEQRLPMSDADKK